MKHFTTIYLWTVLFAIVLFVSGQLLFVDAFTFFEPHVDGILFHIIERNTVLRTSFLFSLTLALIPVLVVVSWRLARITTLNQKMVSALLVFMFIVTGILARHQEVKIYFTTVVKPALLTKGKTSIIYPIDPVNFVYYIFGGLVIGCIISFVLFRRKEKDRT